jgi:MFS family permease
LPLSARNRVALDWLNFFLADVRDGLGPFLAIFLLTSRQWDPGQIGIVLTVGGIGSVVARGPCGALTDHARWKRALIAVAAATVALAATAVALVPTFWPVVVAQALNGVADAIFPSAVAAISLGLVGHAAFTRRAGRNEAFNHAGNAATAIAAGLAGRFIAPVAVLWIAAGLSVLSIGAVFAVQGEAIDHTLARGGERKGRDVPSGMRVIFACRPLLVFTAAITLFHFANAAMLPLVGEELSQGRSGAASLFMAACIITAQIVMIPMAILVARRADRWGRKPLFLLGFAALPLRGLLFSVVQGTYSLIAVQVLDGVGAGIFGALFYVVVADLTRGTGRYNLALGASAACWGLGAALSNGVAGLIVQTFGFEAAFLFLTACAMGAFLLFWFGVPETLPAAADDAEPQLAMAPVPSD